MPRPAQALISQLTQALGPEAVAGDDASRLQWAGDASVYYLVPQVVVFPRQVSDVQTVLRIAQEHQVPVCFRAGGTSLSGQAITDGILLVVSVHLRRLVVAEDALTVRCEPGVVGAWVNAALAPFGRRIGPDPASLHAAEIGGIVANNASGMCCGVQHNSYHTVSALDLVLPDGFRLRTGSPEANAQLWRERPQLAAELLAIRDHIHRDPALQERIRCAFATKNTVGYSLNAFLDADQPADILQRLVVGSEGTLAFIAEATFRTLPLPRYRTTALLYFVDVEAAGKAVQPLAACQATAIELMDAVALRRVAQELPMALPAAGEPAALLVEFQSEDPFAGAEFAQAAQGCLERAALCGPVAFTSDPQQQAALWKVRKGLFPSVGAVRAANTAVIIEDVTFPVPRLAQGVRALRKAFEEAGYHDAVIFGHAKDGNLHFTLTPDLAKPAEVERYRKFMDALVHLVLGFGGHLKAEHGTGRNMAPFVAAQWGEAATQLMRRIKALIDPQQLLNPGVLLSDDPQAHLRHLKTLPAVDPLVDRCIECGFCEPVCPSRDATMSPRQRIAALRSLARGGALTQGLQAQWQHRGLDTCAADGLCATACPVHINTGDLVRAERAAGRTAWQRWLGERLARHLVGLAAALRVGLRLAAVLPQRRLPGRRVALPQPGRALPQHWPQAAAGAPTIVYVPSCLARTMGGNIPQQLAELCARAGVGMIVPPQAQSLCCGQPWSSKGFPSTYRLCAQHLARAVSNAAGSDQLLVVTDTSTCASQLDQLAAVLPSALRARWQSLKRLHPAAFAANILIPRLQAAGCLAPSSQPLVLHPTCSEQKAAWTTDLQRAVSAVAQPVVPLQVGCCGMAGDKGWTKPELTAHATALEAAQVARSPAQAGVCTSTTCSLAISSATKLPYEHLFTVLWRRLRPTGSAHT